MNWLFYRTWYIIPYSAVCGSLLWVANNITLVKKMFIFNFQIKPEFSEMVICKRKLFKCYWAFSVVSTSLQLLVLLYQHCLVLHMSVNVLSVCSLQLAQSSPYIIMLSPGFPMRTKFIMWSTSRVPHLYLETT